MGILKATPAAEREGMARELLNQISARAIGNPWKATEMAGASGARPWVGELSQKEIVRGVLDGEITSVDDLSPFGDA